MISLINLLSKVVGIKRDNQDIWHSPKDKLPKRGRPLVYHRVGLYHYYIGGYFDGKYFTFGDWRYHPNSIVEWAYKTDVEKAKLI